MENCFGPDNRLGDHIDLTPLIDVIFLLLLFFILATTFLKPVVDVILPTAESGAMASDEKQMVVTIDSQGRIHFDNELVSRERLPDLLTLHPDQDLNFMVDSRAPFQSFMDVLDQARIQGRDNFIITTQPPEEGPSGEEPPDEQHP